MWLWVTTAWLAAAVLVAAIHRRWRRIAAQPTPELAAFMLRFENQLASAHPEIGFLGMLQDRFACLLCVDGQETAVPMHELFRHAEAQPDGFARLVASLLLDIREVGLDRVGDVDFAAAAPLVLPQVRSRAWLEQRGTFGGSGLVHTPLAADLVIVYVIDDARDMVFVCREHLRRWRREATDLHNLAVANLARRGGALPEAALRDGALVQTGDGFDAARVLLLDGRDGLLVAIPDRDTLWVGPETGQNLEQLMATTEAIAASAPHPVSRAVFRVTAGQLEPVASPR